MSLLSSSKAFLKRLQRKEERVSASGQASQATERNRAPPPEESSSSKPSNPFGLHILHEPEPNQESKIELRDVDIIAVHGLGGDALGTWTHKNGQCWLKSFLPADLPGVRVYSYGYDSRVAFSRSVEGIQDFARSLVTSINRERTFTGHRPKVFICHSLGGIVVKQALIIANEEERYRDLLQSVSAIVFMGTPHRGSDIASMSRLLSSIASAGVNATAARLFFGPIRKDLLDLLSRNSQELAKISTSFRERAKNLQIVTCFELLIYPGLGKLVVEKDSAALDFPQEELIPIHADHASICCFDSREGNDYANVLKALETIVSTHSAARDTRDNGSDARNSIPSLSNSEKQYVNGLYSLSIEPPRLSFSSRVPGTCHWVLETQPYESWQADDTSSILWITGNPGTGKTVLAEFLSNLFHGRLGEDDEEKIMSFVHFQKTRVCSFFCEDLDERRRQATFVVRSLLAQILLRDRGLLTLVRSKFSQTRHEFDPSFESLWRIFCYVVRRMQDVLFLFIDALDECEESSKGALQRAINGLVTSLNNHEGKSHAKVKVLFTCRPLLFVPSPVLDADPKRSEYRLRMESGPTGMAEDVSRFINSRIDDLVGRKVCSRSDGKDVHDYLERKADYSFLWLSMVLDEIEKSFNLSRTSIQRTLSSIPEGLDSYYARELPKINTEGRDLLQEVLHLLIASFRPLSLEELSTLLSVFEGANSAQDIEEQKMSSMRNTLEKLLGPYVRVIDSKVHFTHSSVGEYFLRLSEEKSHPLSATHGVDLASAHKTAAIACAKYLLMDEFNTDLVSKLESQADEETPVSPTSYGFEVDDDNEDDETDLAGLFSLEQASFLKDRTSLWQESCEQISKTYSAYDYAAVYWMRHVAQLDSMPRPLHQSITELLDPESLKFINWFGYFTVENSTNLPRQQDANQVVLSATFGHTSILEDLIQQEPAPLESNKRFALLWASYKAQPSTAKLLLDSLEPSTSLNTHPSPFIAAVQAGASSVVNMMISDDRFDVNNTDHRRRTALHYAAELHHHEIVRTLLQEDATKTNLEDMHGSTPLIEAASAGSLETLDRLLRDSRIDVNHHDKHGRSALSYAAEEGADDLVKRILKHKRVEGNAQDKKGRNALSWASAEGHLPVVKLLIRRHVSIAAMDNDGRNAISRAAGSTRGDHLSVLECLIREEPGAVDVPDSYGWTPLAWAIDIPGNVQTVKLLVETGRADVNRRDRTWGRTIFGWCAAKGFNDVLEYLLSLRENDDSAVDNDGRLAISHAAAQGQIETVRLLGRGRFSYSQATDYSGRTAVDWAKLNEHWEVVKELESYVK